MNNTLDKVSVVIPVYNSQMFLSESIESLLNQTYKNIEIIAIDDGSTDKSLEILKRYSDKITILHQFNQGLAKALESGIMQITGKWFKWFSPDDVLYDDAIETLVREIQKLPNNTIVYSNWELIDENSKKLHNFYESNYNDLKKFEFNVRLLDGQQINVNTTLIPTSLFENGCVIRQLEDPVAIDYDFFLRAGIVYNAKFYLIPRSLVKYRIQSNQLSHKNIAKTLEYLSVIKHDVLSQIEECKKNEYLRDLHKYNEKKPICKRAMEFGLKFITKNLPPWLSNRLIVFYLDKIRQSR
ncbi:MAG: glycosyltransferase [Nitrosotalea sp.]